jgi:ubiquinol-cytochrome c reductase cytochrome c subunit
MRRAWIRLLQVGPVLAIGTGLFVMLTSRASAQDQPVTQQDVTRTYLSGCAVCHGADAHGTSLGPSLVGVGRASIDYMITSGQMPLADPDSPLERRPSPYSPDLQQALVDYVTALAGGGPGVPNLDPAAADVAAGGVLYRGQCAACHAWSGTGGALLDREAPRLTAATPTQIAEAIRTGPGAMPVFGPAALNDEQLNDTVAFVDSLKRPHDRGGLSLAHLGPVSEGAVAIVLGLGLLLVGVRWIGTDR